MASMGIYAFRKSFLIELLSSDVGNNIGRDIMPKVVGQTSVAAYNFQGYWADVGTVQAYYEANMALLVETPPLDLYDPEWVIHTKSEERPAAEIGAEGLCGLYLRLDRRYRPILGDVDFAFAGIGLHQRSVLAPLNVLRLRERAHALFLIRLGLDLLRGEWRIDLFHRPALLVEHGRSLGGRFGRGLVAVMHDTLLVGPFVGARRHRGTGEHRSDARRGHAHG